jgi:hypothetical protein
MVSARVRLFGLENDEHGMPVSYFVYHIVATDNTPGAGYATVTVTAVSGNPAMPETPMVLKASAKDAVEKAVSAVCALPQNAGLKQEVTPSYMPPQVTRG